MSDPADRSLPGRLRQALGTAYTVESEIGRGGMGVVFHARDERLKRQVAIKVLPPELAFREEIRLRFLREAETAARLSHPNIVPIHSVGEGPDGLVYFVMAYIDGEPLSARLKRKGRLAAEESRRIMMETADALSAAHAVGIIHRDVKPDNILLEGSRGRVMVTDFGIAKALSSSAGSGLTGTGVAIGTPHYMSPEQAAGDREIDGRSDLYSLGVVGYQMLSGELPFSAPTVPGILIKQITELPEELSRLVPDCPEDLTASVMRCLEKEPEHRWPTADALRRALESRTPPLAAARRSASPRAGTSRRSSGLGAPNSPPLPGQARAGSPVPRSPDMRRDIQARRSRRNKADSQVPAVPGEPDIVTKMRNRFVNWAGIGGALMVLDLVNGHGFGGLTVAVMIWGAFSLIPQYTKLWHAGYSWRDVLNRPAAPDAAELKLGLGSPGRARALAPPTTGEFGRQATSIQQVRSDYQAILKVVERLPKTERNLLPDVAATADALLKRAEELARTLHTMSAGVDEDALRRLEARLANSRDLPESAERDRQIGLLERQRQALGDLLSRRHDIEEQIESCVLAMQTMRFDLLRLKSAGVNAVLGDLTQATQQARALSRDVDHAIEAAGEIRDVLGDHPPVSPL
ncbi:MAG TPA: serine/threonine-protein kinase [Gemmatimonadales bacterium]|nr:serine/threonine-protein kinase [Gemmatimonadales bacterium]